MSGHNSGSRLILCADDYALAPGVSKGILRLIELGRLSAITCTTTSRFWPDHARWLPPHADTVDVGLHLTLTGSYPLGDMPHICPVGQFPSLGVLSVAALTHSLTLDEVASEINRQLDAFETHFGQPPDFLDGHQHVQQLPGIRDLVVKLWERRLSRRQTWLRVGYDSAAAILRRRAAPLKALMIATLGQGLYRRARAAGISVNGGFSGAYNFFSELPYAEYFERFVTYPGTRHLVMCHPGELDDDLRAIDSVTGAREQELTFFESEQFLQILAKRCITLSRFHENRSTPGKIGV